MKKFKTLMAVTAVSILATALLSFVINGKKSKNKYPKFFKIGHRGTRGLMPENTIPAMTEAIKLGVNTIELDVHITKDGKVLVYHDDTVNPDYTLMPDGSEIKKEDQKKYTFYQMDYSYIKSFIIGKKANAAFPQQKQVTTYAPLLTEMIDSVELYTKTHKLPKVYYLVEIKSNPQTDGFEQPEPAVLVNKLMAALKTKMLGDRLIIQSFDVRPLKVLHQTYPQVALGFLTGDNKVTFEQNLANLGFNPTFYNPHYGMVNAQLIEQCHAKGMLIAPWTVNDVSEMKRVKDLNVDGIITDYPNYFTELAK